jgi:hypothetical protein
LKFNSKTTYLALFDASNEVKGYNAFFKCFNIGKFKNSLAFIDESVNSCRETLAGILYSALPIVKFFNQTTIQSFYCLRSFKEDIELDSKVLLGLEEVEIFNIYECSHDEFERAPTRTIFHRFIFPAACLKGNYFKLQNINQSSTSYLQRDLVLDVLNYKIPMDVKKYTRVLDNPLFTVCVDLSRFIDEISSLPEVTNSVQDTFLEVIDEILGWSRNHDPSPFPGTIGFKSTMQMYLRFFEDFEDKIKNVSSDIPAAKTFDIALKKMIPCTRSIKRQLQNLADDEPAWLTNAKQFSDAEARCFRQSQQKRQKTIFDAPEGAISMPLLVPYLNLEWPAFAETESASPYHAAAKQLELQLLEYKRFAE